MKIFKRNFAIISMLFALFFVSACDKEEYKINVNSTDNGTISVSKSTTTAGKRVSVTAIPNSKYTLDKIMVGNDICVHNEDNKCEFVMPDEDVVVVPYFRELLPVEVSYNYDDSKVNLVSNNTSFYQGDEIEFNVTPVVGYKISRVTIGNRLLESDDGEYKFTIPSDASELNVDIESVRDDGMVKVSYKSNSGATSTITESQFYPVGTVIELDKFVVSEGKDVFYYIVNGVRVEGDSYVLTTEDIEIRAVTIKPINIFYQGDSNATPIKETTTITSGEIIDLDMVSKAFNVSEGYFIETFNVNGEEVSGRQYQLGSNDVTISLNLVKRIKVTFLSSDYVEPVNPYKYYDSGAQIVLEHIKYNFTFQEGYTFKSFSINGTETSSTHVTLNEDIEVKVNAVKGVKAKLVAGDSFVTPKQEFFYLTPGATWKEWRYELIDSFEGECDHVRILYNNVEPDNDDVIPNVESIMVVGIINDVKATFVATEEADLSDKIEECLSKHMTYYGAHFDEYFKAKEGYFIKGFLINGVSYENSYSVFVHLNTYSEVTIEPITEKMAKVTYVEVEGASAKNQYKYYKKGNTLSPTDIKNSFEIDAPYSWDYSILNGNKLDESIVIENDVEVSLVLKNKTTVTFNRTMNTIPQTEYLYLNPGDSTRINWHYSVLGHCDWFNVNGKIVRINENYVIGNEDIIVTPIVTQIEEENVDHDVLVVYQTTEHAKITCIGCYYSYADHYNRIYPPIDVYDVDEGYEIAYFKIKVNGSSPYDDNYDIGEEYAVSSSAYYLEWIPVTKKISTVTFNDDENAIYKWETEKLQYLEDETIHLYTIMSLYYVKEGYYISSFLVNGDVVGDEYTFNDEVTDIEISVIVKKCVEVTYVGNTNATPVNETLLFEANTKIILNTFKVAEGYEISYFKVNGIRVQSDMYDLGEEPITVEVVTRAIS